MNEQIYGPMDLRGSVDEYPSLDVVVLPVMYVWNDWSVYIHS